MNRDRGQVARYRSRKGGLLTATEVAELLAVPRSWVDQLRGPPLAHRVMIANA